MQSKLQSEYGALENDDQTFEACTQQPGTSSIRLRRFSQSILLFLDFYPLSRVRFYLVMLASWSTLMFIVEVHGNCQDIVFLTNNTHVCQICVALRVGRLVLPLDGCFLTATH